MSTFKCGHCGQTRELLLSTFDFSDVLCSCGMAMSEVVPFTPMTPDKTLEELASKMANVRNALMGEAGCLEHTVEACNVEHRHYYEGRLRTINSCIAELSGVEASLTELLAPENRTWRKK